MSQDDPQRRESSLKQCNVQLPTDLIDELKVEASRLTGHRRRGFSNLLAVCARFGWEAYQRGDLVVERRPITLTCRIVRSEDTQPDSRRTER